jgi:hypothetical protein
MTKDEALKLALEALGWTDEWRPQGLKEETITAIKEALAQPEQEPFMASYEFKQYGYYKDGKGTLKLGNIQATQPPQLTWVGLTDKELNLIGTSWHFNLLETKDKADIFEFARAIEARLKAKNT